MASRLHRLDARLGDVVRRMIPYQPAATVLTRATTDFGSLFMVTWASVGLVRQGRVRTAAEIGVAGVLAWTIAQRIKHTLDRRRPYEAEGTPRLIPVPSGSSMPSGHAAVAAAVATVLTARSRPGRRWPWAVMAAYVPVTRVHLGVHYPGDTMVGVALGVGLGVGVRAVSQRVVPRRWPS